MAELHQAVGATELHTISHDLVPGDVVRVTDGTLRGFQAVVSSVIPSRERVAVLMEILGQQTMIELGATLLLKAGNERLTLFQ